MDLIGFSILQTSASMALQASAPSELRGALGRLGYLCARGANAMFLVCWRTEQKVSAI